MNTPESNPLRPHRISATSLSLGILAVIAVGVVLKSAQTVILPLLLAWLLSYLFAPVVTFMVRRLRFPAPLAASCVILLLLLASWGAGIIIQQRLLAFSKAFPDYEPQMKTIYSQIGQDLDIPSSILNELNPTAQIGPIVLKTSRFFILFISNAILVMVFLVFMLLAKPYASDKLRAAFPHRADTFIQISNAISTQIGTYLGTLFMLSLLTGLCVWGALAWLGVEFAFTWGLLAFVLNFIPTIGSVVASLPPVAMALIQHYPTMGPAIVVAIVLLVIQMFIGSVIGPKVFGDRLNLSPIVILLFLVFWGWLWGITGALLSVPLAAALQITLAHIPALAPIAIMMGSGKRYAKIKPKK